MLFGLALASFTFGLSAVSETSLTWTMSLGILGSSLLLMLAYGLYSRRQPHPIVKTELLRFRTFRISVLGNLCCRLGFGGVPFLVPLLLQLGFGFSPELSGFLLAPIALGIFCGKPCTLPVLQALGYQRVLITNTILVGGIIWVFTGLEASTPMMVIALLTFFYGFVLSIQFGAMNSLAYAEISTKNLSAATSISSTLQQLSLSFGVAVSALLIRLFSSPLLGSLPLTPRVFHLTFFAVGSLTMLSSLIFLQLKTNDGQEMLS